MVGPPPEPARLTAHLERTTDSLFVLTRAGQVLHATDRTCARLGYGPGELVGMQLWDFTVGVTPAAFAAFWERARGPDGVDIDSQIRRKDGTQLHVRVRASVDDETDPPYMVAQAWSIDAQMKALEALARGKQRLDALLQAIPDLLFRIGTDGTVLDFKAEDQSQLAAPVDEIVGSNLADGPLPPSVVERGLEAIRRAVDTNALQRFEYRLEVPAGLRDYECRVVPSGADECVCMVRDVTDRVLAEAAVVAQLEELSEISTHDPLTGLLNRDALRLQVAHAIRDARAGGDSVAVLFVDLDRFKQVNDQLGHATGDVVLREAASALRDSLRSTDAVGRVGGDEFVVLLRNAKGEAHARTIGRKLSKRLTRTIEAPDGPIALGASVGVAIYPRDGLTTDEILNTADRSMYAAKRTRGDG